MKVFGANSGLLKSSAGLLLGGPLFLFAVAIPPPVNTGPLQPVQPIPPLGAPLPGLSPTELQAFKDARQVFMEVEDEADGLGPVFNGVSCAQCHAAGAVGGANTNLGVARVSRIGGFVDGQYSDLEDIGGPVIQARSLQEFDPNYPVPPEIVPPTAQFVSHRITTPLFGAGLIEAIPDQEILQRTQQQLPDGVHGVANLDANPFTGVLEVGRFGWKAQHAKLITFAADAYLNEMGITNKLFPHENLPQGLPIPPGADPVPDPEDLTNDIGSFETFMRFLAPPLRRPPNMQIAHGEQVFNNIRCGVCHVQTLMTGPNSIQALSNKPAELWSDLLLHDMGPGLDDGVQQGLAVGGQWRTSPLWGLSARRFFLHDGRAQSIDQAIRMHGGEAGPSTSRYVNLSPQDRADVITFLGSL